MQGFDDKKLQFTYLWTSLKASKLREKPSALKREHPELQKMKFKKKVLFSRVIFALLDPDSQTGSGSKDHIESGSATLQNLVSTGIQMFWCRVVETINTSFPENENKVFACLYEINVLAT
jgi:hypothetical protein